MSRQDDHDLYLDGLRPTTPSPMMGHLGAPAGAPPLPWPKYLLSILGVPFRRPTVWDDDPVPDPRDPRRPT